MPTASGSAGFEYGAGGRLSRVRTVKDGDEVATAYLYNALGQRVFKGEPQATERRREADNPGLGVMAWLRKALGLFALQAQGQASLGTAYVYGDGGATRLTAPAGRSPTWPLTITRA